jgi:hypothetical protein
MFSEFLRAARDGDLSKVQYCLAEGNASIAERDRFGNTAMLLSAQWGHLKTLKWLLSEGGADISERAHGRHSALLLSALHGQLSTVIWLLREGGASIAEVDDTGNSALLLSSVNGMFPTTQYLLEHGGASIADADDQGQTVWDDLGYYVLHLPRDHHQAPDMAEVTALLRVMVLREAPPVKFSAHLRPELVLVVQEGALLRAGLPTYIVRRRALLDRYCPILAPLLAIVQSYEESPTTEELWATGSESADKRPHPGDDAATTLLRRSIRQRR